MRADRRLRAPPRSVNKCAVAPPEGRRSRRSEQTELVALGVAHDRDSATRELLPFTRVAPAERHHPIDCGIDVLDDNIDVESNLVYLRLGDRLKVDERRLFGAERLKAQPTRAVGPRFDDVAVEDCGPETRDSSGIVAVDRDRPPCTVGHLTIFSDRPERRLGRHSSKRAATQNLRPRARSIGRERCGEIAEPGEGSVVT